MNVGAFSTENCLARALAVCVALACLAPLPSCRNEPRPGARVDPGTTSESPSPRSADPRGPRSSSASPDGSNRIDPGEQGMLAAPSAELVDLPAPPGDLLAEIAGFTDVPSCVKKHASDPLVGDGLEALGYDTFLGDLCRGIQAMKARDPAPCRASLSSAMTRSCLRQVAMLTGDPALCPVDEPRRRELVHDRLCVAAARRDVRPCAALSGFDRISCEALVAHDPARCGTEPRCLRLVRRWMPALPSTVGLTPYPSHLTVEIRAIDDAVDGGFRNETVELPVDAAGGAVLIFRKDGLSLHVGALESLLLPIRPTTATGGFLLDLPLQPAIGEELQLDDRQALALLRLTSGLDLEPATKPQAKVVLEHLDRQPNGVLKLHVTLMMGPTPARLTRWTLDTWIRDVVQKDAPPGAAGSSPTPITSPGFPP